MASPVPRLLLLAQLALVGSLLRCSASQHNADAEEEQAPRAALRMYPPQPIERGRVQLPQTAYFNPREYTSRDFPRFVEGFGAQISRDLEKAQLGLKESARQMQGIKARMDQLEAQLADAQSERTATAFPKSNLLTAIPFILLALLVVLLCANCAVLRRMAKQNAIF